jgi:protocatechuate 3,4-dioxygenase beta subunit
MLVDAVNHREREGATQTTVLGPFYVGEHKVTPHGTDISAKLPGGRMFVQSRVTDISGAPLPGVPVDVWHADDDGFYDSQKPTYETQGPSSRARFITDADGRFFFRTILPCSYPIPSTARGRDDPLTGVRRCGRRMCILVAARLRAAGPHVFIGGDPNIDCDGVRREGRTDRQHRKAQRSNDARRQAAATPWHLMTYEFRMRRAAELTETAGGKGDGRRLRIKFRHLLNPCAACKD